MNLFIKKLIIHLIKTPFRFKDVAKGCLIIFSAALLFTACTKKKNAEYGLKVSETLRVNLGTEPPTLDWNKSTDTTSSQIENNIMEGLVNYNLDDPDLSLLPGLALKWEATNKAQTWAFTLREGVTWTDGVPFTAQQVLDGWERLLNPLTASEYSYFLYGIKNAKAYNEGKIKDFSQVGVHINKKGQLVVELVGPQSYFPELLTHASTFPIRKDLIAKYGDAWTDPKNIITLGPYNLKIWDHDKAIVLTRNENYFGEKAKIKNILAYMINEMSTAINLFDKGELDAQLSLPSTELPMLKKRPEYIESGILSLYYYGMNTKVAPTNNPLVRQALSHAIDRKEITTLLGGGQIPLSSWVPAGMFGYEPEIGLKFDVKKANELLDKAGYKDRSKLPKISLSFNTNENHQRIAENVQSQLKKNLGIQVELQNEEWKVYLNTLKTNPAPLYRMGWLADYPDPDNFLNLMTSYSENNHTGWKNKEFDSLIEKGAMELSKEKRREIYKKAQKILTEIDAPVIPIMSSVQRALVSKRVKNFPNNSMSRYDYKKVELIQ